MKDTSHETSCYHQSVTQYDEAVLLSWWLTIQPVKRRLMGGLSGIVPDSKVED